MTDDNTSLTGGKEALNDIGTVCLAAVQLATVVFNDTGTMYEAIIAYEYQLYFSDLQISHFGFIKKDNKTKMN